MIPVRQRVDAGPVRHATYAVLLLLALVAPLLVIGPASAARTLTIRLTADGPVPRTLTAAAGDMIRFRNDDATFPHAARSSSDNWDFRTGLLAPGDSYTVPEVLSRPGTYTYAGDGLDSFAGQVILPGRSSPRPAPQRSSADPEPSPRETGGSAASPSASPTPEEGSLSGPPLAGGGAPSPAGEPSAPAPAVAPSPPAPVVVEPPPNTGPVAIIGGRLPHDPTGRRYGLPALLAAVAAVGVASLLLRLLLAEPLTDSRGRPRRARPETA